jgi:hypothetical protein
MGTVDTLKAYETLTSADMPERQARALVAIVNELQEARLADVASKADIVALRADLKELESRLELKLAELDPRIDAKIANLRTELKAEIGTLRSEIRESEARLETKIEAAGKTLLKWFIPIILGQTAFIYTILKVVK